MRVLLVRPDPGNERFGLGPFFRVEPLGLGYVAQALIDRGHEPTIADLRFGSLRRWLRRSRPRVVGISCMHALEIDQVLELAKELKRWQIPYLTRVLLRTQRMMKASAYLEEHEPEELCPRHRFETGEGRSTVAEAGR